MCPEENMKHWSTIFVKKVEQADKILARSWTFCIKLVYKESILISNANGDLSSLKQGPVCV